VLSACDVVLTASGTATVQAAIHGAPMVVLYRLSALTYRLFKPLGRVDMYAMVNLISGRRIVRELIQDECRADAAADEALRILTDAGYPGTRWFATWGPCAPPSEAPGPATVPPRPLRTWSRPAGTPRPSPAKALARAPARETFLI